MVTMDEEFQKRLLATFRVEADEHLKALSSGLLELEKAASAEEREATLETVFREAHSLKGAARSVNLADIETICQKLESVFAALKRKVARLSPELFDLLHHALEVLGGLLAAAGSEGAGAEKPQIAELVKTLQEAEKGKVRPRKREGAKKEEQTEPPPAKEAPVTEREVVPPAPEKKEPSQPEMEAETRPMPEQRPLAAETVRISAEKLKAVLLQAEEMLSAKVTATQRALDMREASSAFNAWKKEWGKVVPQVRNLRAQRARFERAGLHDMRKDGKAQVKLHEFLESNSAFIRSLEERIAAEARSANRDARFYGDMVNSLLEDMKQVMTVPFSSFLESFPKYVRDLSRDQGKDVDLTIHGGDLEIDRRILEEMKDPLIHLLRNCIDHGIEKPEIRKEKGKPPRGTVTIAISPKSGGKVEITVSDDGAGIDIAKVRSAAQKLGLAPHENNGELTEQEVLHSIFRSGVSTSPIITEISGRGLGLAIVGEKAEKVGGTVALETRPDAGTTFRIVLPMTIATFRGILVRVEGQPFILPTSHVERVLRVAREEVKTVENRETIELGERAVSLTRLGDVLELPGGTPPGAGSDTVQAVVLTSAARMVAFVVDEVVSEQEVLLKNLGSQLARVRNIAGATVLGSGRVVPVLNVSDLMKSAIKVPGPVMGGAPPEKGAAERKRSILVAEDSITSRTFLKNILESAGYEVATAVDGADAFAKLRSGKFHIVVSDVDMPRMNGFDLTAKIRGDKKFAELPVVLVTALESRRHRERGIDVGANAYIVKSSFDHSNLLDIVGRLT